MEDALGSLQVGTYQGHRIGPDSRKGPLYLDVVMPGYRWCVVSQFVTSAYPYFPKRNTWRAAYGALRRFEGKASR